MKPDHLEQFDRLMTKVATVRVMPFDLPGPDAYEAANNAVLDSVDQLYAVWDGEDGPRSGTATVVAEARRRGLPVDVVWPEGSARTR